jgi:hypothetical protein
VHASRAERRVRTRGFPECCPTAPALRVMMMSRPNRPLGHQLVVLLPTLVVSFVLGQLRFPLVLRVTATLGFGAVLIAGLALVRR